MNGCDVSWPETVICRRVPYGVVRIRLTLSEISFITPILESQLVFMAHYSVQTFVRRGFDLV